jgi:calcium-dependent protein kinase
MGALCNKVSNNEKQAQVTETKIKPTAANSNREQDNTDNPNIIINQGTLVKLNDENPLKNYTIQARLGEGAFGSVDKVLHKETKAIRAMKKISKNNTTTTESEILNEIEMLKKLDHLNLAKIYEFYATKDDYYIVMDYCKGGELFDKIQEVAPFEEKQAAYIIYQVLSAVHFCHSSGIIHRDLKPENILIETVKENNFLDIKVIDFGTAKMFDKNKSEKRRIGSSYYMAPEVLKKNYTEKCDIWSIGVILYILLTKFPPFNGKNDEEIYESIRIGEYDMESPPLDKISPQAKNLISRLLDKDPNTRISAEQALKHDWFNKTKTKELLFATAKKNIKGMLNKLCTYKTNFKLQQVAIAFIVHNISQTEEVKRIFSAFQLIDENGDGRIDKDELIKGIQIYDPSITDPKSEVDKIFHSLDTDNNGFLEFEEFARVLIDKKKLITTDIIKFTFNFFDKDKSGEITLEELMELFGKNNEQNLRNLVNEVDTDKNGKIDFKEFKEMMIKILN